ncbi:MAG: bifunctional DNA-binding transcriptional regulator/O6-methylguanine-DNA methyltransferase Ada [Acidobacteria bacterium]|nr:bifunctional DNA-binding transcriptional regulator/O6-methylguanine-DNA methyltransferase Ada [Acidobacteriota bacterium]
MDARWNAVVARDARADGQFYYSVATTGVYCRPSCGSRLPKPENVAFHDSCEAAERAGFRPCLRCRPNAPRAGLIAEICRWIAESETMPDLPAMAARTGLSVSRFHRVFRSATGLTPRRYAAEERARRVRAELTKPGTVTEALYGAGYGSSGRFYEDADRVLGMTPTEMRQGAAIHYGFGSCSLGTVLAARSSRGVCAILLGGGAAELVAELKARFPRADVAEGGPEFAGLVAAVVQLVEQPARGTELPLDIRGTAFQIRVWDALRRIPPGTTVSYAELAAMVEAPAGARAVARACAANALAVAVPCHRVVRADGGLSGYRWGVERKRELLERERR